MISIASRNKIQTLKVKSGRFLVKLEIHCMTGWKVKFTWNDQNTNHFLENLKRKLQFYSWRSSNKYTVAKCIQFLFYNNASFCKLNFSCFSQTRRNLISTKTKQNANASVWGLRFGHLQSNINVFYFFCMLCRNYKILPIKKKTIILFMRKL